MESEANKSIVMRYFQVLNEGRLDEASALIERDGQHWIVGVGEVGAAYARSYWPMMFGPARNPETIKVISATADDDRVAVEVIGNIKLPDGRDYCNTYCQIFWVRDGRIYKAREYLDTAYVQEMFGANAQQLYATWLAEQSSSPQKTA